MARHGPALPAPALGRPAAAGGPGPGPGRRARGWSCSTSRSPRSTPRCGRACGPTCAGILRTRRHDRGAGHPRPGRGLSWADHVAVIRDGRIGQSARPRRSTRSPVDPELARFLGEANLVRGVVGGRSGCAPRSGAWPLVGRRRRAPREPRSWSWSGPSSSSSSPTPAGRPPRRPWWSSYEYFGHDAVVRVRPEGPGGARRPPGGPGWPAARRLEPGTPGRAWPAAGPVRGLAGAGPGGPRSRPRNYAGVVRVGYSRAVGRIERRRIRWPSAGRRPVTRRASAGRRSARWWASPTASSTTGPGPACCARRWPRPRGSGTKRRYSYRDVLELKVIKQLLDAGVSLQSARRAVDCLREDLGADLASANLVLTGTRLGAGPLQRRGRGPAGRRPGRLQHRAAVGCGRASWHADIVAHRARRAGDPPACRHAGTLRRPRRRHEPPGSDHRGARASGRRRHPSCVAGGARRASPIPPSGSSPPCSTSHGDPLGVRAGGVRPALGPARDRRRPGFRPDFWLPDHRCFVELTTADQRLVTRKNAKVRRMRELYPEVELVVVYQRDFLALLARHGLDLAAGLAPPRLPAWRCRARCARARAGHGAAPVLRRSPLHDAHVGPRGQAGAASAGGRCRSPTPTARWPSTGPAGAPPWPST